MSSYEPTPGSLGLDERRRMCKFCLGLDLDLIKSKHRSGGLGIVFDEKESMYTIDRNSSHFKDGKASCQICALLVDVLFFFKHDLRGITAHTEVFLRIPTGGGNLEMSFLDIRTQPICVQLFTTSGTLWEHIRPLPDIYAHRTPANVASFITQSMHECLEKHPACRANQKGRLPTRLLDVDQNYGHLVRLIDTKEMTLAPYMALSYCWGPSITTKATVASIDAMRQGIEITTLPAAYVDAVRLCRQVGVRYLWIDALCIIQDSPEDWEKESSAMCDVYSNAYLTIAAESTNSATQGFLQTGPGTGAALNSSAQLEFSKRVLEEGSSDSVTVKARAIHQLGVHWRWIDDTRARSPKEPLSRRGWTLQERLLSTRLLSLSLHELQWICQEATFCECKSQLNRHKQFGPKPLSQISSHPEAFRFWLKVIENYSRRSHTVLSDKLPAISGVAEMMQRITGSEYLAGLWLDNIYLGLVWQTASGKLPRSIDRIPSFSWASINGEVDYQGFRNGKWPFQSASSIISYNIKVASAAPLGRTNGGVLTLRGPLIEGFIKPMEDARDGLVSFGGQELLLVVDTFLEQSTILGLDGEIIQTARRRPGHKSQKHASAKEESPQSGVFALCHSLHSGARCWALRIGAYSFTHNKGHPVNLHELLVLGKSPRKDGCFERIGMVSCRERFNASGVSTMASYFDAESIATVSIA